MVKLGSGLMLSLCLLFGCGTMEKHEGKLHEDLVLAFEGESRSYHLYVPESTGQRPLVLLLHGGGGVIDAVLGVGLARSPYEVWLDVADEEGLFIAAPQGLDGHWNDCRSNCSRCGENDDAGFLLALVEHLALSYAIDRERVYVVGESNGGFMAQRLAQEFPEQFAGIGVTIALEPLQSECTPKEQPMRIMFQVGTRDEAILYDGGYGDPQLGNRSASETLAVWAGVNGCNAEPKLSSYADLDPEDSSTVKREDWVCTKAPLTLLTLEGAGHVTASLAVEVSSLWEGVAGIQNHDIESAREFWRFFEDSGP